MRSRSAYPSTADRKNKQGAREIARRQQLNDPLNLYLLSFLLTADPAKAERCFVAGLDFGAEDNAAFRKWTHSWVRRIVVRNAIRLIAPRPDESDQEMDYRAPMARCRRVHEHLQEKVKALFSC